MMEETGQKKRAQWRSLKKAYSESIPEEKEKSKGGKVKFRAFQFSERG
jgi:hypothetical protein